ncbi:MAG: hypothetical protein V4719_10935 [Planctomycetota bacterium]
MDKVSQQLEEAATNWLISMRLAEGFNEAQFKTLVAAIRRCHKNWADSEMLPKSVVATLIDLPRIVESCAALYKGAEQQRIIDASHELVDVILEGF